MRRNCGGAYGVEATFDWLLDEEDRSKTNPRHNMDSLNECPKSALSMYTENSLIDMMTSVAVSGALPRSGGVREQDALEMACARAVLFEVPRWRM